MINYNHFTSGTRFVNTVPVPLRCYGDNYNVSVYDFMEQQFMGFQFPNLTTFLGLMPQDKRPQVCVMTQETCV